jgi:energy-coupling factor transporter ATP-binding protein EcfA2
MRLVSATVRNYRILRELSVQFDARRTVIGGPNESGKSTLVEAIHRALFFRYKSTAGLEAIRPRHQSGFPEVIVEFDTAGVRYTLRKLFRGAQGSVATLTVDSEGLQLDGDKAEERLRGILAVDDVNPGQFREQWSHLWVWQGKASDDPTSPATIGSAAVDLQRRLGAMTGENILQTDRDERVLCRIVGEHTMTFTNTGRLKTTSELGLAEAALNGAKQHVAQANAQLQAVSEAVAVVLRETEGIAVSRATMREAETALAAAREKIARIDRLEEALGLQRTAAASAAADYAKLADANTRIDVLQAEIKRLRLEIAPAEQRLAAAVADETRLQGDVPVSNEAVKAALHAQQEGMEEGALLEKLALSFTLRAERVVHEATAARIAELNEQIAVLDDKLRHLPPVDARSVDELDTLDRALQTQRSAMRAVATRLEVVRTAGTVAIDGRPIGVGGTETLTDPADVAIDATTVIRVTPGGGQSLADLRLEISNLQTDFNSMLSRLGVDDVPAARRFLGQRAEAESARREHQSEITAIGGSDVVERLAGVGKEIADVDAEIDRRMPPDRWRPESEAALLAARTEYEARRRMATALVEETTSTDARLRTSLAEATAHRRELETAIKAQRSEIEGLEGRRQELEETHGTDRAGELERRALRKQQTADSVTESQQALAALQPAVVRTDATRFQRALEALEREIAEAGKRQAEARGRLQQAGTVDLHETKAAADSRLELASRRHEEISRRARAVQLLREMFERRRQEVADRYAEPLRAKVAEYVDALYGPGSRIAVTIEGGSLKQLQVARPTVGGTTFDFGELSGGTREQVATACRLAMAEILVSGTDTPETDRCLPIVLDDAFTNSDPERIRAVQRVLDLGASRGLQIIVLSCKPSEYGLLGAQTVVLSRPALAEQMASFTLPGSSEPGDGDADIGTGQDGAPGSEESPSGGIPDGTDEQLAALFMQALESAPGLKSGNKSLREQLRWDTATYDRIRDRLTSEGRIERGQGRGGSVRIPGGVGDGT